MCQDYFEKDAKRLINTKMLDKRLSGLYWDVSF